MAMPWTLQEARAYEVASANTPSRFHPTAERESPWDPRLPALMVAIQISAGSTRCAAAATHNQATGGPAVIRPCQCSGPNEANRRAKLDKMY